MNNNNDKATAAATIPVRCCPFCGSEAQLLRVDDRYGVQCVCGAGIPPAHGTEAGALVLWNRRSGGAAAAGGRATRGLSSARKRAASRRNLRLARASRRVIRIEAETRASALVLKDARQAELALAEARAAQSRVRLKERESQILADPALAQLYALLDRPRAVKAAGQMSCGG
jgi:Restriction alleviation protein Lar